MTNHIPQDQYNEIISLIPIVCVDVAIVHDDRVLLIKRRDEPAKGEWWLPGGRLYKGEELQDCAIRKARAEVGLKAFHKNRVALVYHQNTQFPLVHSVNFCYVIQSLAIELESDGSWLDYKWIGLKDELSFFDYHDYVHNSLLRTFDYLQVGLSAYEV